MPVIMQTFKRDKKRRYIPMIFAAGGWNANVLYVWATPRAVSVLGFDPVVTAV